MTTVLLLIVLLALLSSYTNALHIDLNPGDVKCVGQELDQEDIATFVVGASTENKKKASANQKLTALITDPDGGYIVNERIIIGARPKEYNKDIEARGVYEMCFTLDGGKHPVRVLFHVNFRSRDAIPVDASRGSSRDDLPSLANELKAAEHLIAEVSGEIEFARQQESLLKEAGESTTSRLQWFSWLSMGILFFTSIWQIIYLRRYFTSKKLL